MSLVAPCLPSHDPGRDPAVTVVRGGEDRDVLAPLQLVDGIRQGAQDLDRGGLAGAVRAEKPGRLPGIDVGVDAADGIDLAVLLGQRADRDSFRHTYASCPASSPSAARVRCTALPVSATTLLACSTWSGEPAWATRT